MDVHIWSITNDSHLGTYPHSNIFPYKQLNGTPAFIDARENLVTVVGDPPLRKFLGFSKGRGVCNGSGILKSCQNLIKKCKLEKYEVVDYITQDEILIVTSEKDTIIADSKGNKKRF